MLDCLLSSSRLIHFHNYNRSHNITHYEDSVQTSKGLHYGITAINVAHILAQLLIIVPFVMQLLKSKKLRCSIHMSTSITQNIQILRVLWSKLNKCYAKTLILWEKTLLAYSIIILSLSFLCFFMMIQQLFSWPEYCHLFTVYCLVNASISTVNLSQQTKESNHDYTITFILETYKYLNIVFATIMFGIAQSQKSINICSMAIAWVYFLSSSRDSLPYNIFYYLSLQVEGIISLTALVMISLQIHKLGTDKQINSSQLSVQSSVEMYFLAFLLIFILLKQIIDIVKVIKNFKGDTEFKMGDTHSHNIQFYGALYKFVTHTLVRKNQSISSCQSITNNSKVQETGKTIKESETIEVMNPEEDIDPTETIMNPSQSPAPQSTVTIQSVKQPSHEQYETCSICLQHTICQQQTCLQLKCHHIFHLECLEQWMLTKFQDEDLVRCPMCRRQISIRISY